MMEFTDDTVIDWGQHKGTKLANIPAKDLLWYYDQDWFKKSKKPEYIALKAYIEDNMDFLKLGL